MNEDPAYLQTVSLHLARVLDEIGLNYVTVKKRRCAFLFDEHLRTLSGRLRSNGVSFYNFGSQTEGTTTPGLDSDLDTLNCHDRCIAIQDWEEWQQDKWNTLMLHEDTAPGYCRLQALESNIPMPCVNLDDDNNYMHDSEGRVIVKNVLMNNIFPGRVRNGPAQTDNTGPGFMDMDTVAAFICGSWPRQAEEFTRRHRRHNWPTRVLLQQVIKQGCFLVPVGHKLSPTERLEWRISASLAERYLMFSLNIVHIKVYVLLKMLKKTFLEPRAKKSITSYHCKTALFYCIENTEAGFWVERNLLQCVIRCLAMFVSWITEGFCPQFIIPEDNLFAGKVTAQNRNTLQSVIKYLIMSNGRVVLGIRIDDLGLKLQAVLSHNPSVLPVLNSPDSLSLIGQFEHQIHSSLNTCVEKALICANNKNPITAIRYVYTNLVMLNGRIRLLNKTKQRATKVIIENLYRWMGSLLASVALSHKMRVPRVALHLLCIGAESDVSAMLKLASVIYSSGDYSKVETVLQGVSNYISNNMIEPICMLNNTPITLPQDIRHILCMLSGFKACAMCFSCVTFNHQEIRCAPSALRHELFRSVGDDLQQRIHVIDDWMDLAVVDCIPYLHYLQYLTYRQLGKQDQRRESLGNLKRCIGGKDAFSHPETALNLLGKCVELEEIPEAAFRCYRSSLEIRPRNNAANWHAAILCYKVLKPYL